ncbi:hypothetical protein So717_24060 [Roseobacter cerasinus]|uniref:Uncharacterized protein n=1 Tax=Roseobacter cerasinus TaxID=2602289 RepID=A0A640VQZ8_9RHOB|nr:hypothetical protein [Roseobacter cerasinus]GFE50653.1 hypothetical protein So717_24060 [Roseobacter cerasinus]
MAIISTLIGGVSGFAAFLAALTIFNVGFVPAVGAYLLVGFGVSAMLIVGCLTYQLVYCRVLSKWDLNDYSNRASHTPLGRRD